MSYHNSNRVDWDSEESILAHLDTCLKDLENGDRTIMERDFDHPSQVIKHASRYALGLERALSWLVKVWPRKHRWISETLRDLIWGLGYEGDDEDEEMLKQKCRVLLMNHPMHFNLVDENTRRRIMKRVVFADYDEHSEKDPVQMGDLSDLGIGWISCFNNLRDWFLLEPVRAAMQKTHAVEFLIDGGHDEISQADQWLLERIEHGQGAVSGSSKLTTEFLGSCHLLESEAVPTEERVRIASEMIMVVTGRQSRREREIGLDSSVLVAHTKLRVLNHLVQKIADTMTDENAGTMLRHAMISHRRHKHWVWQRLTKELRRHHWQIKRVQRDCGEVHVEWMAGNRKIVILNAHPGELEMAGVSEGGLVLIPGTRQLGTPEVIDGSHYYRTDLVQPLRPIST